MKEMWVRSLIWEDPLEEEMATHSSVLAREVPRTEEPGGLWSMGSQRLRHDLATKQQQQHSWVLSGDNSLLISWWESTLIRTNILSFDRYDSESESEVDQSCLTLFNPIDCSLPGSSIRGIFQARVLEWVAISFSSCPLEGEGKEQTSLWDI